jgi:hypothetical protein
VLCFSRDELERIQALACTTGRDVRDRQRFLPEGLFETRESVLPMHSKELKTGIVEGIKKQLGLKGKPD